VTAQALVPSGYFPIAPRTRLRLTGADAVRYLNGQVTNDARKVSTDRALRACVLTVKGRLCAVVSIWSENGALIVDSDPQVRDELAARLERYIVADDVALEDISDTVAGWHVIGAESGGLEINRLGFFGRDVQEKPEGLRELSDLDRELLRITYGMPAWGAELREETLPHEALLEASAVDFKKGCYVGQEVVSRVESVGRVNRILSGLTGNFPPAPGLLFADDKRVGEVTSAILEPETGKTLALGYIHSRCEAAHFIVQDESGACIGEADRREFPAVD
jgi:folate-binding protein YgfZ